jgi:signal transduction histidine kinase
MNVSAPGGQFKVRVPVTREPDLSSWVDSEVLIEGVCGSLFNADRQLIGILFYVPRLSFIKVEKAAREVPFSALLRFSPGEQGRHRVQVRGVVAYQQPGNALFLQSHGKGLRVLTQQDSTVEVGDIVDVLGFPAVGESSPVLEDAVFHRVGRDRPPQPVKFDPAAPWEHYDGALLTMDAKLLDRRPHADGLDLVLQHEGIVFDATLASATRAGRLQSIPLNSELRVTGICLVRSGGLWRVPESFRMLLRSAEDVAVRRTPSWWNLAHTLWVLGITLGVLLVMIAWNLVLKRRVREQMAVIRQKLRRGAVLEERNRIARELHDTLEQELAGITMQLDLAADCFQRVPDVSQRALQMARKMSRHSMIAARRSVWDLRCHWLEHGDLVSALQQAIAPMAGDNPKVVVQVQGTPVRLAAAAEMNLLRIGQEAVANAIKHAQAQHISVRLEYVPGKVRLRVTDDGRGFALDEASLAGNGHFGMVDMRERAQSLGCSLAVSSQPGKGTRIEVEVAVATEQPHHEEPQVHTHSGG